MTLRTHTQLVVREALELLATSEETYFSLASAGVGL